MPFLTNERTTPVNPWARPTRSPRAGLLKSHSPWYRRIQTYTCRQAQEREINLTTSFSSRKRRGLHAAQRPRAAPSHAHRAALAALESNVSCQCDSDTVTPSQRRAGDLKEAAALLAAGLAGGLPLRVARRTCLPVRPSPSDSVRALSRPLARSMAESGVPAGRPVIQGPASLALGDSGRRRRNSDPGGAPSLRLAAEY